MKFPSVVVCVCNTLPLESSRSIVADAGIVKGVLSGAIESAAYLMVPEIVPKT